MSVPVPYPGLTFYDAKAGMLIVFLRPSSTGIDGQIWVTLVLDRAGKYDTLWESTHTARYLLSSLPEKTSIERIC